MALNLVGDKKNETSALMIVLGDTNMMETIFSYIGRHSFVFVASVNKPFYEAYTAWNDSHEKKCTSIQAAFQSISCAKMYLECRSLPSPGAEVKTDWELCSSVAAKMGRLDILCYLRSERIEWDSIGVLVSAAAAGHLHVIKYLHEKGSCSP